MTLTKEWLQQTIAELEEERNAIPGVVNEDAAMALAAIILALASMTAEPVAVICFGKNYTRTDGSKPNWNEMPKVISCNWLPDGDYPVYLTAPPAPVVPDERYQQLSELYHSQEKRLFKLAQRIKGPSFDKYAYSPSQAIDVLATAIFGEKEDNGSACRATMLQGADQQQSTQQNIPILRDGVEALRNSSIAIDGEKIQAERDADALSALIEGMEVSVDVSTCDADAGRPYFGTVTEISELDGAKNGCILLVQIAGPNFKPTGNSPAIPDGYALVPVELTGAMTNALTDAILDDLHYVDLWRSVLAAAPQQESK